MGRVEWNLTRSMSEPHRKYAKEDSSSYKGKRWSYQVLDSKIIDAQKNVPIIDHFVSLITESVLILVT